MTFHEVGRDDEWYCLPQYCLADLEDPLSGLLVPVLVFEIGEFEIPASSFRSVPCVCRRQHIGHSTAPLQPAKGCLGELSC